MLLILLGLVILTVPLVVSVLLVALALVALVGLRVVFLSLLLNLDDYLFIVVFRPLGLFHYIIKSSWVL